MSEVIKDNEAIAADSNAFLKAFLDAERVLGALDGVVAVGYGHKQVAGKFTDDVCIHVFVREKKPTDALPPEQCVPKTFGGYRTDVRVVSRLQRHTCTNSARYATIRGGMMITAMPTGVTPTPQTEYGTLGLVVRKRQNESDDNWYILSAEHVIYANGVKKGDRIYQPIPPVNTSDGRGRSVAIIEDNDLNSHNGIVKAYVPSGGYPSDPNADPPERLSEWDFYVDCAIARIETHSKCCESICTRDHVVFDTTIIDWKVQHSDENEPPQPPESNTARIAGVRSIAFDTSILTSPSTPAGSPPPGRQVFKVGAHTDKTMGVVRGIMTPIEQEDNVIYKNVIEIEFAPAVPKFVNDCNHSYFSEKGDSGSVVVDAHDNIVGLVFGGPIDNPGITHAAHIIPVIDQLGICIPNQRPLKKAMSYGCADAEDGSGTKRYPKGVKATRDPSTTLFDAASVTSRPAQATPADQERMEILREKFRATRAGRELLEILAQVNSEIGYLVRNSRPVMITWHRHRGPAFLALVLAYLRGEAQRIPSAIDGVTRTTLLARMRTLLDAHGSPLLRNALERHGGALMALADAETLEECLDILCALEREESPS